MILVLWRRGPSTTGFAEWQDLLLTLALFELPLKVVIADAAAASLSHPEMQARLKQLADISCTAPLLLGAVTTSGLETIDEPAFARLCRDAQQLVHC